MYLRVPMVYLCVSDSVCTCAHLYVPVSTHGAGTTLQITPMQEAADVPYPCRPTARLPPAGNQRGEQGHTARPAGNQRGEQGHTA